MKRRPFLTQLSHAATAGLAGAGVVGLGFNGIAAKMARAADPVDDAETKTPFGKAEHCLMIWLGGGMAQIDTFDPKPMGDAKARKPGGYYPAIETAVPGVQVCEHLSQMARRMERVTALRCVHHDVVDEHAAATNRMHTGRETSGTVQYPSLGSIVAHQRGAAAEHVPAYVLIGYPNLTRGPGFLGQKGGYVYLTDLKSGPVGFSRPKGIGSSRQRRREQLQATTRAAAMDHLADSPLAREYDAAIAESQRLTGPEFMRNFDLTQEQGTLRDSYGSEFGQRLLVTRRLFESGVRFAEVSHNMNFRNGTGWDTHKEGQLNQHLLIQELDTAIGAFMDDLESKSMLDKTLIVINTEFGRPADFDAGGGRGHHSGNFSTVLAGGGLRHCGAYGVSDERAEKSLEGAVSVPDMFATIFAALQIDPYQNLLDGDRPVPITDGGSPIGCLFT
ncbi:MAG: DUF1501 domain-containing protein [Aureliella sp.]